MIAQAKIEVWLHRFSAYRHPPRAEEIRRWFGYFDDCDENLASSVLDRVRIISEQDIQNGYRHSLNRLPGWHQNQAARQGRWFFSGYGGAGESGQAMLRVFREANGLGAQQHQQFFVTSTELPSLKLTAVDTVVFVDDFAGSGRQVCRGWPITKELLGSKAHTFLVLCGITLRGRRRISYETGLRVVTPVVLEDYHNVFHGSCTAFTTAEKARLLAYCTRADPDDPKGFGDCGLLLILAHRTPNNSLPILHVNVAKWRGLFPRYL